MALVGNKTNSVKSNANFDKADAFMNVALVDKHGNEHSLGRNGIPLHVSNWLQGQIIEKVKENPDSTFKLVGTVHIVVPDDEREKVEFA